MVGRAASLPPSAVKGEAALRDRVWRASTTAGNVEANMLRAFLTIF
jgi:hypothetical protein